MQKCSEYLFYFIVTALLSYQNTYSESSAGGMFPQMTVLLPRYYYYRSEFSYALCSISTNKWSSSNRHWVDSLLNAIKFWCLVAWVSKFFFNYRSKKIDFFKSVFTVFSLFLSQFLFRFLYFRVLPKLYSFCTLFRNRLGLLHLLYWRVTYLLNTSKSRPNCGYINCTQRK